MVITKELFVAGTSVLQLLRLCRNNKIIKVHSVFVIDQMYMPASICNSDWSKKGIEQVESRSEPTKKPNTDIGSINQGTGSQYSGAAQLRRFGVSAKEQKARSKHPVTLPQEIFESQ